MKLFQNLLRKVTRLSKRVTEHSKKNYIMDYIESQWKVLCNEYNIDMVACPLIFSDSEHILHDVNKLRIAKGLNTRESFGYDTFFTTMHVCMNVNNIAHNELVGVVCNMTNIMSKFTYDNTYERINQKLPLIKTLIRHEIGHVIVESAEYEGYPMDQVYWRIQFIMGQEQIVLGDIQNKTDNYSFAHRYFQLYREAKANEAVGISLDEICNVYARL